MKEFIYLDTDYISSALAQINKGTILTHTSEVSDSSEESTSNSDHSTNGSNFGLNVAFNLSAGSERKSYEGNSITNIEMAKEVITKSFDDYSYDLLYKYIVNNKLITHEAYTTGDFVEFENSYKLVSFEFLHTLLDKDFVELYVNSQISVESKNLSRNKNQSTTQIRKKELTKNYDKTRKNIETVQKILPSDILLQMRDIIAPIKPKFLRDDYRDISFKYDSVHLLARITRIYKPMDSSKPSILLNVADVFLPNLLNTLTLEIKEGTFVATPIAIYIE